MSSSARSNIRRMAAVMAAAAIVGGLGLRGAGAQSPVAPPGPKRVTVFMYSEYIDPEIPKQFTQKTGLEVRIDVYEAEEEMIAKMQAAGGASQYDVIVASNQNIPILAKLNLLQPLDLAKIPNRANVMDKFLNPPYDPGNKYGLPYQWGTMGLIYRIDKVPNFEPSWSMIFDEARQPASFVLLDEVRSMLCAPLIQLGYSINTRNAEEVKKAGELMLKAKSSKKCLGFDGGVAGKNKVVAGDAAMAIAYNGDAVRGMEEDKNVRYVTPKEGTLIWVDCMVIAARAPNPAGAHQFINYILEATPGAQLSNFNRYATPNKASLPLITKEDRENPAIYPSDAEMAKMQLLEDVGKDMQIYDEVWTTIKTR